MAKKTGTYRQIVSIPADLKRRMDKVADQVNWSALAAAAFEKKLAEITAESSEKKDMNNLIQRLRAAKADVRSGAYKLGHAAGKKWVERHANFYGIKNLAKWKVGIGLNWEGANLHSSVVAEVIRGANKDDYEPNDEKFWDFIDIDAREADNDFLHGFVDGVEELWDQVKHEVE